LVYFGGPVQPERGFIVHRPNKVWQSTLITSDDVGVTSSQDILHSMAKGEGPKDSIVILGYAGWGAGQLEQEIANNMWLTVLAEPQVLFDMPYHQRWNAAARLLGVDLINLTDQVGHA
jgi:putative transcriptional regulator